MPPPRRDSLFRKLTQTIFSPTPTRTLPQIAPAAEEAVVPAEPAAEEAAGSSDDGSSSGSSDESMLEAEQSEPQEEPAQSCGLVLSHFNGNVKALPVALQPF